MKKFLAAALGLLMASSVACTNTVDKVNASILRLTATVTQTNIFGMEEEGQAICTGFVVRPEVVLTANHCVGKKVTADGVPATVIHQDQYFDLALLKVNGLTKKPLYFSDYVEPEDQVIAIGYGFGWGQTMDLNLKVLMTSQRPSSEAAAGIMLQGSLVGGMSGGPLVNQFGEVIAVNQQTYAGISYGVGVPVIRAFLYDAGVR